MSLGRVIFVIVFAMVATWGWMEHSRRVEDDRLAAALEHATTMAVATVNPAYLRFQREHRRPPDGNVEAGLPPPVDPSWQGYDSVQLYPNGDIRFEFHDGIRTSAPRYAYVWRSSQRVAPGSISCAVRGIPMRILSGLRMHCNVEITQASADESTDALPPIPRAPPQPADLVLAAVERDDAAELVRLRQAGASFCQADSMNRLALAEAARGAQIKALTVLLGSDCPIDALEPATGRTALMVASAAHETDVVELLLLHGANPALPDTHGESAWILLGAVGRQSGNPDMKVRTDMLARGADIEARDAQGQTLLMAAASAGAYDLVQWLLARGASLDAQDIAGRTALMHAVSAATGESSLPMLLQHGASLKLTDKQGLTAAALAQQIGDSDRRRRVEWLLSSR